MRELGISPGSATSGRHAADGGWADQPGVGAQVAVLVLGIPYRFLPIYSADAAPDAAHFPAAAARLRQRAGCAGRETGYTLRRFDDPHPVVLDTPGAC